MFSPEASIQSARSSLRNPRRRQRKDSDGLQQQPRRKRSKLSEETFQPTAESHINGNGSASMNGHVDPQSVENSVVLVDMPVREKKVPPKRAVKDDTTQYLTKNVNYSVKRLPSFPPALSRGSTPFRASALPSVGLALALTTKNALLWDYNAVAGPTKVLSLPLPFDLKPSDPLPFGAIVRNGPTNDFGVVAVAPSTGKITFWENVESAEARNLFPQRHQGVDGALKLFSGEVITDLVDVEHAGYILVLSSGRLAQMTLRDSQGRLNITTTVLSASNSSTGSFFSFKGLLGGAIRKTVASVKARPSETKGQMEVISATRNGLFQLWDLSWSGQQIFKYEVDIHGVVLSAIQDNVAPDLRAQHDAHILDFAIMEEQNIRGAVTLLVLVAFSGRNLLDYSLLEVDVSESGGIVNRTIPIRNFHQSQIPKEPIGTLLVPQPGHSAFVQFPGGIFVTSLSQPQPEESPETQILSESGQASLPFQDTIYFREDGNVKVSGHALELVTRRDKQSNALIFIQDYGILQISAQPPVTDDQDQERIKVTARSKLEQATFFSTIPGTVLDFSIKSRYSFSEKDTAQAALDISSGVLSSSFDYLDKVTASMDDQFKKRAFALRTLITQLRSDYPTIPFQVKWRLLWQAEKLAAAHKLWNWYQDKLQDQQAHPDAYPEKILMGDIVKALNEKYKTKIETELGETDPIRQYFLRDVESLHVLVPWSWFYLRTFYINKNGEKERSSIMQRLSEGTDVMLVTLETGFNFRKANIESYGLDPESLDDGILRTGHGYDMLPHFWTSSHNIVNSIRSLIDVGRNLAVESFEQGVQEDLAQKIGKDNPRLVRMGCHTHIERFQWALEQSDEKQREMGRSLREEWNAKVRPAHIYGLLDIGLATDGMNLAEQYRDMTTLVNIIWDEATFLEATKANSSSKMEQAESTVKLNRIRERIGRYFDNYGDEWAEAFYTKYIKENQSAQLFAKEYLNQPALTKFLRADSSRARLAWINEVCGEQNYDAAAKALYEAATKQETNAWCNKVELSIAKLAMLCKKEAKPGQDQQPADENTERTRAERAREVQFANTEHQLVYAKIQDLVYERLLPIITGALDDDSAVELVMAEFGQGRLKDRPAHQSILKQGFEDLIHHKVIDPALMIDILTLMTDEDNEDPTNILQSNEFVFALRVLTVCWTTIHRTTREGLLKLIWKRVCIKDNWAEINNTKDISDATLNNFLINTTVGWTFKEYLKMIDDDPTSRNVWPKKLEELLGAGGTHGELCVRFGSEDLREPIIKDNLLDDEILRESMEKHRLADWFTAACKAAKKAYEASKNQELHRHDLSMLADSDDSASVEGVGDEAAASDANADTSADVAASDTFEGDVESVADQNQDEDVEMQD